MDDAATRVTSDTNKDNAQRPSRRAPRLRLEMPVLVSFPGESSYDEFKTVEVAILGALLAGSRTVAVGQELLLTNPKSWEQITCHVRSIRPKGPGVNHVGVEFATEWNDFWDSTPPSEECNPTERKLLKKREDNYQRTLKRWRGLTWPTFVLAGLVGLISLFVARSYRSNAGSAPAIRSVFRDVSAEEARLIPGIENYRLATPGDFDPDAVSWLTNSGQQTSGEILGAFSVFGQSRAYVLVGKDAMWRIVIFADGQLRCDAQYQHVAIVARVPKQATQKIIWANPPPAGSEGDGLLIVRTAKDLGSAVVLFLQGDQIVSGTPVGYWEIPLG